MRSYCPLASTIARVKPGFYPGYGDSFTVKSTGCNHRKEKIETTDERR
jgi:hypothetical protein